MKINITIYSALAVVATLLQTSCSNDTEPAPDTGHIPITFVASYPGQRTRVTANHFDSGDQIGVYVAPADQPLQIGGNLINNEPLTYDGNDWHATESLYWSQGSYNIYAYYPYTKDVSSIEDQPFSVSTDQSTQRTATALGGYEASDLLYASGKDIAATSAPIPLVFKHIMSRLTIRLIKGEDFEGEMPTTATVYVHNTIPTATIDLQAGVATRYGKGSRQTIIAHQDGNYTYSAIIVPQRVENRMPLIEVVMKEVSYIFESTFQFKAGTSHLVNLVISDNPDQVKIDIGGEIRNWN